MTTMLDSRAARYLVLITLASGVAPALARADVAHLKNGQTVEVSGFTIEGERIILALEGGGELAIPIRNVASIQRAAPERNAWRPETPRGGPADQRLVAPGAGAPAAPRPQQGLAPGPSPGESFMVVPAGAVPDRARVRDLAARIARKHQVDERLVLAVIEVESRYDALAVSPRGAVGLMQLMPETAVRFAINNPYDPVENIDGGVRYLKELLERYSGQRRLVLAAYNAGEEAVDRFGGIPPFPETILYVDRVLKALGR